MLEKIITWSIRNRILVLLLSALALGLGVYALSTTPVAPPRSLLRCHSLSSPE